MTVDIKNESVEKKEHTWSEEIEIAGGQLVDRVKELIEEGTVRRLIIRRPNSEVLIEVPLVAGIAVGGAVTLVTPLLAAIGAMAALVTKFTVEIVRTAEPEETEQAEEETLPKEETATM